MDRVPEPERQAMNTLRWLLLPSGILAGWIGIAYMTGDPIRTSTPSFRMAQDIAPMEAWGVLFATGAIALIAAGISGRLNLVAIALFIGGAIYSWWASLFLVTLIVDDHASIVAPGVYYFLAFTHFAGAWRMFTRQPRA